MLQCTTWIFFPYIQFITNKHVLPSLSLHCVSYKIYLSIFTIAIIMLSTKVICRCSYIAEFLWFYNHVKCIHNLPTLKHPSPGHPIMTHITLNTLLYTAIFKRSQSFRLTLHFPYLLRALLSPMMFTLFIQ